MIDLPSCHSRRRTWAAVLFWILASTPLAVRPGLAQQEGKATGDESDPYERLLPPRATGSRMAFVAKARCSLRSEILLPFRGEILEIMVPVGGSVKRGDPLVRYRISAEARAEIGRRVRAAEFGALDVELLREQLNMDIGPDRIPTSARLVSPSEGTVIWMHSELRVGAVLDPAKVLTLGVMDPMVLVANAYEGEALRLSVGDVVDVRSESLPDFRAKAAVSRVSWSPVSFDLTDPSYYEVLFEVRNPGHVLREGQRVIVLLSKPPPGVEPPVFRPGPAPQP